MDEPPQRVLSLPIEEPGEVFNANDQCSFVYGKGVTHCNFMVRCGFIFSTYRAQGLHEDKNLRDVSKVAT